MNKVGTSAYYLHLFQELLGAANNDYEDNYDHLRFGAAGKKGFVPVKQRIIRRLNTKGYYHQSNLINLRKVLSNARWLEDFAYLYDILEDQASKDLLIKIVAYRLLGHRKVRLPL